MLEAVAFEMDALVDLESLATLRRRARWQEMSERVSAASIYPRPDGAMAVLELPAWIHDSGARVGVFTDLPRPAALAVAERFGTSCNRLIDASDGLAVPPDPAVVVELCGRLGVSPGRTLVVGARPAAFAAAARAGAVSAGVAWAAEGPVGWGERQPDLRLGTPEDLAAALDDPEPMRAIGEVLADGGTPAPHQGSVIKVAEDSFASGRHFTSTDRRLSLHRLTALILDAKVERGAAERLGQIMARSAKEAPGLPGPEVVVGVPPRRSAPFEHLGPARATLARALGAADGEGALAMVVERDDYRDLSREERRKVNEGRFEVTTELAGEKVMLIDDVITSGAQTRACRRRLLAAGAGEVFTFVAAATQAPLQRPCPGCGQGVMRRIFGQKASLYVCSAHGCRHTERWDGQRSRGS